LQKLHTMSENTYNFDPDKLSYEHDEETKWQKFLRIFLSISLPALIIAGGLIVLLPYFAQTPKQKAMMQEERVLKENYKKLLEQKQISEQYMHEIREKDRSIYKQVFEAELHDQISKKSDIYMQMKEMKPAKYTRNNAKILDSLSLVAGELEKESGFLKQVIESQKNTLDFIPAIQPLYNPNINIPVYGFGRLIDPIYKTPAFHRGIDFAAPQGTPIFATADGRVSFSGQKRAKGLMVEINHGNGYVTQYAHMSRTKVRAYTTVKRGDLIGYVGNTGKSFIEHLHYEIQFEGTAINPVNYFFLDLSIEQYSQMLEEVMKAGISLD
jgi:murein DD-endopeptidase MepM/ murein hydrolase activator NlpD